MTKKTIKCAKCQQNAETDSRIYRSEYASTYPIRDQDGKIYCWDCYKSFSHCQGCRKSVANLKFSRSGQPTYPHCNGGYSSQCERISNKVQFICSKKCAEDITAKKRQEWKEKLNQGWTKCEECVKFWTEEWEGETLCEWAKEEKNQWKIIKLAQPDQGKLCSDHKSWEEGGKQRYEEQNTEYQKRWELLTEEEKLSEVKSEYRYGENITEIATHSQIPWMVLHKWQNKDSHRQHNCPDCQYNYPCQEIPLGGNTNNLSPSDNSDDSHNKNLKPSGENQQNTNYNPVNLLIWVGGGFIVFFLVLGAILTRKKKKTK